VTVKYAIREGSCRSFREFSNFFPFLCLILAYNTNWVKNIAYCFAGFWYNRADCHGTISKLIM
jgi:hypothetical protein